MGIPWLKKFWSFCTLGRHGWRKNFSAADFLLELLICKRLKSLKVNEAYIYSWWVVLFDKGCQLSFFNYSNLKPRGALLEIWVSLYHCCSMAKSIIFILLNACAILLHTCTIVLYAIMIFRVYKSKYGSSSSSKGVWWCHFPNSWSQQCQGWIELVL